MAGENEQQRKKNGEQQTTFAFACIHLNMGSVPFYVHSCSRLLLTHNAHFIAQQKCCLQKKR